MIEGETSVYRYFSRDDELLYIGLAVSPIGRMRQHRMSTVWFASVVRIEIQAFPSRAEAAAAEKQAIRAERPKFNKVFAPGRPRILRPLIPNCTALRMAATAAIDKHGSVRRAAHELQLDPATLHRLSTGQRTRPRPQTAAKLGLMLVNDWSPL